MKSIKDQNSVVWSSNKLLFEWVKKNGYIGWDPYDGINSEILRRCFKGIPYLEIFSTQLNVYSIVNLRPILRIEKGRDVKGAALFIQAYSKLYNLTGKEIYKKELEDCTSFLKENSLKDIYNFDCWSSHYFPYISADKIRHLNDIPDIIGTGQAINAFVKSYKVLDNKILKDISVSGSLFIINQLLEKRQDNYYFKYYSLKDYNTVVFNASAQGLECLSNVLSIKKDKEINEICEKIVRFLIENQKEDGSWIFSINEYGKKRIQLDFHQGYIIDGLLSFLPYANNKKLLKECIEKGANYYKNNLFLKNGQSYYRYPIKFPIDIHNQSQGIITFSKLALINPEYLEFAKNITEWTINNMQDPSGYFYHQKWPIFTNKIPYIRWSQAWMMLALTTYLEAKNKGGI